MEVKVVSRKLIKPHRPTPENLNKLNLSFLDELAITTNAGIILLYPNPPIILSHKQIRCRLLESLSKTLTQFYPLAGRYIRKDHYIDCADQGVEWVDAEATEAEVTDAVVKTEAKQLKGLLPRELNQVDLESLTNPLVSIQMTVFKCNGFAIGINIWHGICDAPSFGTFIKAWSNTANSGPTGSSSSVCPSFDLAALFPRNLGYLAEFGQLVAAAVERRPSSIVAKRFRFNKEAIASVRSRYDLIRADVYCSRVRAVCAVITKALMGVDRKKHGKARPIMVGQMVNMRGRTVPPTPEHSFGNMISISLTPCIETTEEETDIQQLVRIFEDGLQRTISECAQMFSPGTDRYVIVMRPIINLANQLFTGETNVVVFSDGSKLELYEADFGWGKPVGIGTAEQPQENSILLMESKEIDGLEAWVHLTPDDMTYFEQDQEIKKLFFTT